jgi:hypothetical protein
MIQVRATRLHFFCRSTGLEDKKQLIHAGFPHDERIAGPQRGAVELADDTGARRRRGRQADNNIRVGFGGRGGKGVRNKTVRQRPARR